MPREPKFDYVPDWMPERAEKKGTSVRSEQPIVTDGQLGGSIDRGPERRNPEGSSDISNVDYDQR